MNNIDFEDSENPDMDQKHHLFQRDGCQNKMKMHSHAETDTFTQNGRKTCFLNLFGFPKDRDGAEIDNKATARW